MKLLPLESADTIELVASWLAREENYQWLDFGNGQQIISPAVLKIMSQRATHLLRVYTSDDDEEQPIGIVGLENINRKFGTATLWGATGDKSFRTSGYAAFAASIFMSTAFSELQLKVINTWVVDGNPSQRLVEKLGFRYGGRQRQAHVLGDERRDRLMYDLLASEHREMKSRRPQRRHSADGRKRRRVNG
jgi:RimJ/RimL family protein N-acetyltransferase